MKKLLVVLMTMTMLFGAFAMIPASAADASPVKDYATANYGDLLYTVNFKRVFLNGRSVGGGVDGVADGGVLNVIVTGEGFTLVHKLDLVGHG